MSPQREHLILNLLISLVWLINGLFCKALGFTPRHEQIVASILGEAFSEPITILIGLSEILMAIWILSRYKEKLNAVTQIVLVIVMNTIELLYVPELLLWGKLNYVFALIFVAIIYYNQFILAQNFPQKAEH